MSAGAHTARPAITLKLATSLDGRIALANGESKWITGAEARLEAHKLRAAHDAIIVGSETVLADDPELTARLDPMPEKQPLRIVADGRGRLSPNAKIFRTVSLGPVAIATLETTDLDALGWPSTRGLQYWMTPPDLATGHLALSGILEAATRARVVSLMVEGGGQLAASFMRAGVVDRIEWFRAPIVLGGDARPCLGGLGLEKLGAAPNYQRISVQEVGADLWESYERKA
jgi:diaminohydroxyphosphoribosylaminopyrimidine deaminase/5-amino-6-(5-phosphoribosylamino)uracil reductase